MTGSAATFVIIVLNGEFCSMILPHSPRLVLVAATIGSVAIVTG